MSLRRKILYGFSIALVVILLLLPATAWITRVQLIPFVEKPSRLRAMFGQKENVADTALENGSSVPGNFDTQYAQAITGESDDAQVNRLKALSRAYPHSPVVIATLLQAMSASQVLPDCESAYDELYGYKPGERISRARSIDPARVARFIALANEGERLEPANAFFSMMASAGYFAAHREIEAVAAWIRASEKNGWDDYTVHQITASWKRDRQTGGGNSFSDRASYKFTREYRYLARLQRVAHGVIARAVREESAGEETTGFRLRRATRLNGERLLQGKSLQEAMTGHRIAMLAVLRPGGAPAERNPHNDSEQEREWKRQQRERYCSYLLVRKHPEEAGAFARIIPLGNALDRLAVDGYDVTYDGFGKKTWCLIGFWGANMLILTAALFALAFAAIFELVFRFSPHLQRGEPLQNSARWGVALGLLLPLLAASVCEGVRTEWSGAWELSVAGGVVAGLLLVVPPVLGRFSARAVGHGLLLILATVVVLATLVATGIFAWSVFGTALREYWLFTMALDFAHHTDEARWTPILISCAVIVVPLVLLGMFALFSRMLRIPVAAGVTRGMRATAVPLAAALLLVWAGTVLATLREEQRAIRQLEHVVAVGEPHALSELLQRSLSK